MKHTLQETFDAVWNGLKSQGFERSFDTKRDHCAYRGDDGLKCAVGHLIPDAEYRAAPKTLEGHGVSWAQDLCPSLREHDTDLLINLQTAHDRGHTPEGMEQKLREVAKYYCLTVPE